MRVAVTGASSHLGANLVRTLLERGQKVRAVSEDHPDDGGMPLLHWINVEQVHASVRDADGVALYVAKYVTKDLGKPWFLGNLRDARRLPTGLLPAGKENDDRRSHLYNSITTDEVGGDA